MENGLEEDSNHTNEKDIKEEKNGTRRKESTTSKQQKYGCPVGFERVSQYICLQYRSSPDGNATQTTLSEAQSYCRGRDKESDILFIQNNVEALSVWKWLGKQYM